MTKTLYQTISDIAMRSFPDGMDGYIDEDKQAEWFSHWFRTAENYRRNLIEKGLTHTADDVTKLMIDQQTIIYNRDNKE